MNLEIIKIENPGDLDNEKVVIKANLKDEIGQYILADTLEINPGRITGNISNAFWFPNQEINPGDSVIVYTKEGQDNQIKNGDESTAFNFYRGKNQPSFNSAKSAGVLIQIGNWNYKTRD